MSHLPALFLHSGFRTGSTWFWNCFRRAGGHGYYEPLHGCLAELTSPAIDAMWPGVRATPQTARERMLLNHPALAMPPFEEFRPLLRPQGGVSFYELRFAYQGYFETGPDEALARYIRLLNAQARRLGRVPVLGFCRSLSRTGWFKGLDGGIGILAWRNPWDQWTSYHTQATRQANAYFEFRAVEIAGIGRDHPVLGAQFADLDLPPAGQAGPLGVPGEAMTQLHHFRTLDAAQRFRIFLRLYTVDMLHALTHADLIVNLDRMTAEPDYREEMRVMLSRLSGLDGLDFADCRLPRHVGFRDAPYAALVEEAQSFLARQPASPARAFLTTAFEEVAGRLSRQKAVFPSLRQFVSAAAKRMM